MTIPPEFSLSKWFPEAPYYLLARPADAEGHPSYSRWQHHVRIWNYQAFAPRTSWSVFTDMRPVSGRRAVVRRVVWTVHPSPLAPEGKNEIVIKDAILVPDEVDQQLQMLDDVPLIPFLKKSHWGLDGETTGIEKPLRFSANWWCDGPPEWELFIRRVQTLKSWLESKFPSEEAIKR